MKKQTRSGKACCSALEERFEVIRVLGSGSQGTVFLYKDRASGSLVACKTSHAHCPIPSNNRRSELKASGLLHMAAKLLRHAFPGGKPFGHCSEKYPFTRASKRRKSSDSEALVAKPLLPEPDTAAVVASVANALVVCHSHGLVHRDVKLENVFVHDKKEDIFLADFGVADLLAPQEPVLKGHTGTPMYMAPEVLQGRPYDHHADIWSLGVLMHLLLTGLPLPAHGKPHPLVQDYGAWDLLLGMLSCNPADRLTAEQVLSHGWIATWVSSS
ncbi:hypothetical protein KP509_14G004200 [Ceratopteris richardii]|uniref:Protein kinase domain-containing protein n=1 Tax=Ceratopteris richardii TaxID=49495 RepID=A0A8T2T9W4_CERRI|nr:hypothetical protein KP509_14G004200 [Ceratopteris richardii]